MAYDVIGGRFSKVRRYLQLSYSPLDWFPFAVLGVARRVPFVTRRVFPELVVRPAPLGGLKMALNPLDMSHIEIFRELFFDHSYDLGLIPFTPDQIFDCGGHIGMFALLARGRYPTAHLIIFEPNHSNMAWIRRQVQLNGLDIEAVQAAVSVRDGEALFEDRVSWGGHLVADATPGAAANDRWKSQVLGEPRGRYGVQVIDLAAMLAQRRPQRLLLKLDVEGEEIRIIPTLFDVLPRQTAVFFETHHGQGGWDRISQQFKEHGFAVERRRSLYDYFFDGFALRQ